MSDSQQRYRVVEKLESGGMAEVFRAESEGLQGFRKQVAIKRVLPHLSSKKKFISMFLDEARLSAQLSHSNCVQVFDIGVGDNAFFIVMEFVDGANLKAIIEHLKKHSRDFPVEGAVYISLEICKGLAYAHELTDSNGVPLHIVHRDMSPPNVLITKHGEVKIVDFGLAKANSQLERSEPGIIKGKFSYLSPEAAMAQEVDARTDVFAVGIILWELLAGQRLFLGETDFQTVKKVQSSAIPSIVQINPRVPPDLERIINRALAREPAQRYQTARSLGMDLSKFLFKHAVPVSTFDIGTLVQGAMRERQRYRPAQTSIIDKLIEEALLEFTSLTDDAAAHGETKPVSMPALHKGNHPLSSAGYVSSWIDEIAGGTKRGVSALHTSPPDLLVGNLASLEEEPGSPHATHPPHVPGLPGSGPSLLRPPAAPSSPAVAQVDAGPSSSESFSASSSLPPAAPSSRSSLPPAAAGLPEATPADRKSTPATKVGVVVALVVVMAAGAAAWFTHLIPHP
jgi:eukaryotic-like serine/threonine-protein kinase